MLNSSCPVSFLARLPGNFTEADEEIQQLTRQLADNLSTSIILASAMLVASLFVLFFGKKLVKPTIFLGAFGSVAAGSFYIANALLNDAPHVSPTASCALVAFVPLVLGVLAGLMALCMLQLGFAILGAAAGVGVGYTAYVAGLSHIPSPAVGAHDVTYIVCLSVCGLLGTILMLKFSDSLMIIVTSLIGAVGSTPAVAMLLAHVNANFLGVIALDKVDIHSKYIWPQALFTLALFVLGLIVQCRQERHRKRSQLQTTALRPAQVPLIVP